MTLCNCHNLREMAGFSNTEDDLKHIEVAESKNIHTSNPQ